MSANPHAYGGVLLRELALPGFRDHAVPVPAPGAGMSEAARVLGDFLRDVITANLSNFRLFGPGETESNRGSACGPCSGCRALVCPFPVPDVAE
jgi:xylulose-5-phosphate/fructose-6-phosphate phosphoketolase